MNNKYLLKAAFLCFILCLILSFFITCKSTSAIPAKLILHAPLYGTARTDGTLYIFGEVTNVGSQAAYNAQLVVIVNEGEREYGHFLGDFEPGECKHFECDLVDYHTPDEARCTFRLSWNTESLFTMDMESLRLSIGD